MPLTLERRSEIRDRLRRQFAPNRHAGFDLLSSIEPPDYDRDDFVPSLRSVDDLDPPGLREIPQKPVPVIVDEGRPIQIGRLVANLYACSRFPGKAFTLKEAAELEGVSRSTIVLAASRKTRVRQSKIKFTWRKL